MPNRLLVFLAAGSSVQVGIPSTQSITDAILPRLVSPPGYAGDQGRQHFDALNEALVRTYGTVNFEHFQHGLEALSSLNRSLATSTVSQYRIVEAALTAGLRDTFPTPVDPLWLIAARSEFLRALQQEFSTPDAALIAQPSWPSLSGFLQRLTGEFDIRVVTSQLRHCCGAGVGAGARTSRASSRLPEKTPGGSWARTGPLD